MQVSELNQDWSLARHGKELEKIPPLDSLGAAIWNMNDVIKIIYKDGYIYHIVFDDGTLGDVDFSEYPSRGLRI